MSLAHNWIAHRSPEGEGKQHYFMFWLHSPHLKSSKSRKADKVCNPCCHVALPQRKAEWVTAEWGEEEGVNIQGVPPWEESRAEPGSRKKSLCHLRWETALYSDTSVKVPTFRWVHVHWGSNLVVQSVGVWRWVESGCTMCLILTLLASRSALERTF